MFPAALAQTFPRRPRCSCIPSCFARSTCGENWSPRSTPCGQQAGFAGLPALDALWQAQRRIISTSLKDFDAAPLPGWDTVCHAGPVLEDEKFAVPTVLPWAVDDPAPLVLVSFSTGFEQRNVDKVQRSLDALADLPVHVVATTGGIVAPNEVASPANAIVLNYAAHDPIIRRAAMVLTHGGHGTAMRSLLHGVPMVVVPGLAGDQPFVAAAVQEFGAGRRCPATPPRTRCERPPRRFYPQPVVPQRRAAALDNAGGRQRRRQRRR